MARLQNNNRFTDSEITGHGRNNIRLQCSEHEINILQELNMATQGMERIYSKHVGKCPLLTIIQKGPEDMMATM